MLKLILLFFTLCCSYFGCTGQSIEWLHGYTGTQPVNQLCVLPNGNIVTSGWAAPTLDFGSGQLVENTFGTGSLVTQYTPEGKLVWYKVLSDTSGGITTIRRPFADADGNIYISGLGDSLTNFAPGTSTPVFFEAEPARYYEYLAKYRSDGTFQWVRPFQRLLMDVDFDERGFMYLLFQEAETRFINVMLGDSIVEREQSFPLALIQKRDTEGRVIWQDSILGSWNVSLGGLRYNEGALFITGSFTDTVDLNPGLEKDLYITEDPFIEGGFVVQWDTSGNWIQSAGFTGPGEVFPQNLEIDDVGGVYVSGNYGAQVDFDPGPDTMLVSFNGTFSDWRWYGREDIFLLKLTEDFELDWVRTLGGFGEDRNQNLSKTPKGIVLSGFYYDSLWLGHPNRIHLQPGSIHWPQSFVACFTQEGDYTWSLVQAGETSLLVQDLDTDESGNVYVCGHFNGQMTGYPGSFFQNVTLPEAASQQDAFLEKIAPSLVGAEIPIHQDIDLHLFPNPSDGAFHISGNDIPRGYFKVNDLLGRQLYNHELSASSFSFEHGLAPGVYQVQVYDETQQLIFSQKVLIR